jgi:hypothetical protein
MASDPYFSSVKLLLHCDGTDNSTTFTDSEITPKTVTRQGDAHIHTGEKKFGSASAAFDGIGDYLTVPASGDFDITGDYTVECWYKLNDVRTNSANQLITCGAATNNRPFGLYVSTFTGLVSVFFWVQTNVNYFETVKVDATGVDTAWHHVAGVVYGSNIYVYVDGVQKGTIGFTGTIKTGQTLYIGRAAWYTSGDMVGYMDDLRITKGVARYTANFDVPTKAFPDYQYEIAGTITEALPPTDWIVRASRLDTGALIGDTAVDTTSSGAFVYGQSIYGGPVMVTAYPKIGTRWLASTVTAVGDYVFPTHCTTTPYFFKATARSGDYKTHTAEPTWDTTTGNTTTDNQVTWTCMGPLIQPITQSPLIPA